MTQEIYISKSQTLYQTVILPVVLYGCETWSLREEYRLKVFENRVHRRGEVVGDWRRLHNEELRNLYASPNIARVIK
jgi:hypothetical protein